MTTEREQASMAIEDVPEGGESMAVTSTCQGPLFDHESGLVSEALLRHLVSLRLSAARERLGQLWLAVIEPSVTGVAAPASAVGEILTTTLDRADAVARLANGRYAVLFDAVNEPTVLEMLAALRSAVDVSGTDLVLHAGVAAYPQHGFDVDEVLDAAGAALAEARTWPMLRIEVAPLPA